MNFDGALVRDLTPEQIDEVQLICSAAMHTTLKEQGVCQATTKQVDALVEKEVAYQGVMHHLADKLRPLL